MNFISIDVETANRTRASICAIGIAVFQDWQLTDKKYYLVNPQTDFDIFNIRIHKIKPEDVLYAPTFTDLYPELNAILRKQTIVSYTLFDQNALEKTLERYRTQSIKYLDWIDACEQARYAWPHLNNHKLKTVVKALQLPSFEHHNALADACVAGLVYSHAVKESQLTKISPKHPLVTQKRKATEDTFIKVNANTDGPFYGESIVFTGGLSIARSEAAQLAANIGCNVQNTITHKTTILVVGNLDATEPDGHKKSRKHLSAEELIRQGFPIRIITEKDFAQMVNL